MPHYYISLCFCCLSVSFYVYVSVCVCFCLLVCVWSVRWVPSQVQRRRLKKEVEAVRERHNHLPRSLSRGRKESSNYQVCVVWCLSWVMTSWTTDALFVCVCDVVDILLEDIVTYPALKETAQWVIPSHTYTPSHPHTYAQVLGSLIVEITIIMIRIRLLFSCYNFQPMYLYLIHIIKL